MTQLQNQEDCKAHEWGRQHAECQPAPCQLQHATSVWQKATKIWSMQMIIFPTKIVFVIVHSCWESGTLWGSDCLKKMTVFPRLLEPKSLPQGSFCFSRGIQWFQWYLGTLWWTPALRKSQLTSLRATSSAMAMATASSCLSWDRTRELGSTGAIQRPSHARIKKNYTHTLIHIYIYILSLLLLDIISR